MNFLEKTKKKYYEAVKRPLPLIAGLSVTQACNLRCKLCGAAAGEPAKGELTTKEARIVIDNLAEAEVMHLSFGGGEPLVRDDILELASYASGRFRSIGIVSNGYLIDENLAKKIAAAGVKQMMISIDGLDPVTHDFNRGEGSYDRALAAVKYLKLAGITVRISFTISMANYSQLSDIIDKTKKLDSTLHVQEFFPGGRGKGMENLALTRRNRRDMQRLLFKKQADLGVSSIGFENRYIISEDKGSQKICTNADLGSGFYDFCVGCFTGIYSLFVSSTGELRLCGRYGEGKLGNLKETPLSHIWQTSKILKDIRNRENLEGRCGKCNYRYICGGCRKNAYFLKNNILEEDPLCWRGRLDEELESSGI